MLEVLLLTPNSGEEICREAGVSKMTFCKHFENKTELLKSLITRLVSQGVEKYRNIMDWTLDRSALIPEMLCAMNCMTALGSVLWCLKQDPGE